MRRGSPERGRRTGKWAETTRPSGWVMQGAIVDVSKTDAEVYMMLMPGPRPNQSQKM